MVSTSILLVYLALYRQVSDDTYVEFLIEGFKHLDKNAWLKELTEKGEALRLLITLLDDYHQPDLEVYFVDGCAVDRLELHEHVGVAVLLLVLVRNHRMPSRNVRVPVLLRVVRASDAART